jgi:glycosyltransferase involved in cell wall biosynthesis
VEASGRWLLDLQEEYAPDIVHLNSYGHGALPWDVPVVLTAHSCVLSWWSAVKRTPLPRTWERYRHEVEYSLRSADVVTAPSRTMADSIQENYGTGARVVYNGRNHAPYRPATKEPIILAAGRVWDEAKNIAAVVRAGAQLDWPVFVAGELGRTDVADHRAPQSRFLGKLCADELAQWYGRSSIYALPARYEPFGLSALEAALSGCALVLGDIPSLREVWADAALFVAPEDDNALAAGLRELIADADLRFRYAQRAAERAREYTAARMGSSYREIYQTAMQPRRTACAS